MLLLPTGTSMRNISFGSFAFQYTMETFCSNPYFYWAHGGPNFKKKNICICYYSFFISFCKFFPTPMHVSIVPLSSFWFWVIRKSYVCIWAQPFLCPCTGHCLQIAVNFLVYFCYFWTFCILNFFLCLFFLFWTSYVWLYVIFLSLFSK